MEESIWVKHSKEIDIFLHSPELEHSLMIHDHRRINYDLRVAFMYCMDMEISDAEITAAFFCLAVYSGYYSMIELCASVDPKHCFFEDYLDGDETIVLYLLKCMEKHDIYDRKMFNDTLLHATHEDQYKVMEYLLSIGVPPLNDLECYPSEQQSILRNWRSYLPPFTRYAKTNKYYPKEFKDKAKCFIMVCKGVPKDVIFLMLEYIARAWKYNLNKK